MGPGLPLVVLTTTAASGALIPPALADGEPLGGRDQRLALGEHQAGKRRRQLRPKGYSPAAFVLQSSNLKAFCS